MNLILTAQAQQIFQELVDGIVPKCNPVATSTDALGNRISACGWPGLFQMAENIINLLTTISFIVAAGFVMYGGFLYLTSAGGDRMKKGKTAIKNALIGLIIVLIAWVVINLIMNLLTPEGCQRLWYKFEGLQCGVEVEL